MTKHPLFIGIKHLSIWGILHLLLVNTSLEWGWTIASDYSTFWVHLYGILTNAIIFYVTSFYLIPRLLNQQKRQSFIFQSILFLFIITSIEVFFDAQIGAYCQNKFYQSALKLETWNFLLEGFIYNLPANLVYYFIAFAYRGPIDRQELYERKLALQKEKLEGELELLKSQIHPHTLFNGMSSIYHLIDTQPQKAKKLVLNLSNALRYHLYESSEELVLLSKELHYLRQFIALNQVRIEDDALVEIDFDEFEGDWLIAPLLFTPIIENAFKYVSLFPEQEKNKIGIQMKVNEDDLHFSCRNTIDSTLNKMSEIGGIGIKNIRSRLDLIYGQEYEFEIQKDVEKYTIHLKIPLKEML